MYEIGRIEGHCQGHNEVDFLTCWAKVIREVNNEEILDVHLYMPGNQYFRFFVFSRP